MEKLERQLLEPSLHDDGDSSDPEELAFRPVRDEMPSGIALRHKLGEASRTGPKGVLADWRHSSKAHGSEQPVSSSDEEGEEDERAAVERYRKQRMAELQAAGTGQTFGHLREIGIDQFEAAVLQEDSEVKVVLHLYEPYIKGCSVLSQHLSSIARLHPRAKFLRARASQLEFLVDDDVLPTLLVYQGGELIEKLIAIDLEWDKRLDVSEETVQGVLESHGVLTIKPPAFPRCELRDEFD